ncbi:MAG: DUF3019 domain-containing protein [Aliiglaciecola sp.]|uniref:DUF3019 domain-containing protein n=1 Tax=Aliiglaciecola sp. TaxID=1872441 RepID=UPI003297606E
MKHLESKTILIYFFMLTFMLLAYLPKAWSNSPSWHVQPKVCIVENLGDTCEMVLTMHFKNLAPGAYCYYQGQTPLNCWTDAPPEKTLVIRFIEETTLYLKSQDGSVILSHTMDIKARANKKQVRRVRQPWSLF